MECASEAELPNSIGKDITYQKKRGSMNYRILSLTILTAAAVLAACAPATPTQPPVDVVGTRAMELASIMLTETVAAYSPTPEPTFTPEPPTATPTLEPTPAEIALPITQNGPGGCYIKPDVTSTRISFIDDYEEVELLAIGSTPGWYKITNPYFGSPCWIEELYLKIDPNMDLSVIPIE